MACISRQNVGKYTYLYESASFRDQNGRPRNKKVSIGKIDPVTGMPVFKKEYLERMAAAGTPIEQESPSIPRETNPNAGWRHSRDPQSPYLAYRQAQCQATCAHLLEFRKAGYGADQALHLYNGAKAGSIEKSR